RGNGRSGRLVAVDVLVHIDSHQHVHRDEPARSAVTAVARDLHVPLRHFTPGIEYWGQVYGQSDAGEPYPELISVDALIRLLSALPPGVTELGCHPGHDCDINAMYAAERLREMETLCSPGVRAAIRVTSIELCTFGDLDAP